MQILIHARDRQSSVRSFASFELKVIGIDRSVVRRLLKMMRGQADRQDWRVGLQAYVEQAFYNCIGYKFMAINATIDDQSRTGDRVVIGRKTFGQKGHFERSRYVEDINVWNKLLKAKQRLIDNISVPFGFDERKTGWCHL